jgi:predicted RNA-binding protein YlqC (UPF0109 family)
MEENETDPLEIAILLTEVVRALVDHPERVKVSEQGTDTPTCLLLIEVEPSDVGKVLGKDGRTVKALREVFTKIAAVDKRRAVIEVVDPRKASTGPVVTKRVRSA